MNDYSNGKILTISIAAYNTEQYLNQAIQSICVPDIIEKIEIFIVDDGGTDNSLKIAQKYADLFPGSVFPVHKENGGWGSTVNYSIEHATGKYFKLLDGDDYFNTNGLTRLVDELCVNDVDLVFSPYRRFDNLTNKTIQVFEADKTCQKYKKMPLIDVWSKIPFAMHGCTISTKLLQNNNIKISEHCFYTDTEFITKSLAHANSVYITDIIVYEYRIGREGQSIDLTGLRKHYQDNKMVFYELASLLSKMKTTDNYPIVSKYFEYVVNFQYQNLIKLGLRDELIAFDKELKNKYPIIYNDLDKDVKWLRKTNFCFYKILQITLLFRQKYSNKIKMVLNQRQKRSK